MSDENNFDIVVIGAGPGGYVRFARGPIGHESGMH